MDFFDLINFVNTKYPELSTEDNMLLTGAMSLYPNTPNSIKPIRGVPGFVLMGTKGQEESSLFRYQYNKLHEFFISCTPEEVAKRMKDGESFNSLPITGAKCHGN